MNNVRTVSDTKREFYKHHTRPINSIYQRVVEELMVEMHLLLVNVDFHYDPIYALGVVTAFDRFMAGYRPEQDKASIFEALCQSVGSDAQRYHQDAEQLTSFAKRFSVQDLISWLGSPTPSEGTGNLYEALGEIANNPKFKYSRLFAIGLYTLLESADGEVVQDDKQRNQALLKVAEALHLPGEKLQKDLELYRSNLEKITQARIVLEDVLKADRKKREQRAQDKNKAAVGTQDSPSKDEAPSS